MRHSIATPRLLIPATTILVPLLTVLLAPVIGLKVGFRTADIVSLLATYCLTAFGITLGYHRGLAHKSFSLTPASQLLGSPLSRTSWRSRRAARSALTAGAGISACSRGLDVRGSRPVRRSCGARSQEKLDLRGTFGNRPPSRVVAPLENREKIRSTSDSDTHATRGFPALSGSPLSPQFPPEKIWYRGFVEIQAPLTRSSDASHGEG